MSKTIRVMLIEDNPQYRDVIGLALEEEPDIHLVSQFSTAEKALENLEEQDTQELPDLILLDLRLPGMDGIETLSRLREVLPESRVIVLTQSDNEADVLHAISRGASGYLLKSATADQLIEGIRTVVAGGSPLDAGVARLVVDTLKSKLPGDRAEHPLTEREIEILSLLSEGLVKKEISSQLNVSYSTVDKHVSNIYEKLGVSNAPAAISWGFRSGLLSGNESPDKP